MSTFINRDLPNDEYQAAVGANNPSASNVFATIADLPIVNGEADAVVLDVKINQTGGINKGQAVYVNGASGTNILVGKADFSTEATSSKTLGLLITSGANNAFSKVITQGSLKGTGTEPLDTSAGAAGDPVWLGDDGNLIYGLVNKPYAPNHLVFIGVVVESNNSVGEIYVKTQNGFELDELHDVDLESTPPVDNDVLTFNAFTQLWEPKQITATGGNRLISGGASWSGIGMVFDVTALVYEIDGTEYNTAATNVTLANGDPTNPRFDAIVSDDTNTVYVITGTPAANPLAPAIPGNAVLVQYILVGVGATTPSVSNEFVYRQGSAPDWVPIVVGGSGTPLTAVQNSTTPPPFEGGECLLVNAPTYAAKYVQYTKGTGTLLRSAYPFLSIRFRLPVALPARNVFVQLLNNNTAIGLQYLTSWGASMSSTGSWQLVVIPTSAFGNAGITSFNRIRIYFTGSTIGTNQFAFDDIKFQTGFGPQVNTATIDILDSGTVIGSTAKLNFTDGTNTTAVVTQDVPNNKIDVKFDTPNITLSSAAGTSLVNDGTGPALALKGLLGGTGITLATNLANTLVTITNVEPDQIVALTSGTGINVTGTYPNFTIANTAPDQIVSLTAGTNIGITGTYPNFTINSTALPAVQSVVSAATVTPTFANDLVKITAQAVGLTLAAPTGTAIDGKDLIIRIKDNGSAQTITWTSGTGGYRAIGVTLPTTTTAGKTTYVGLIYNSDDSRWDVIGVTTQA